MAKRGRLFDKGIGNIVEEAVRKIQASGDIWVTNTSQGFRTGWALWMSQLEPQLRSTIQRLPPLVKGDIRANVVNRVVPVATLISVTAQRYRSMKVAGLTTGAPPPTPPARITPTVTA